MGTIRIQNQTFGSSRDKTQESVIIITQQHYILSTAEENVDIYLKCMLYILTRKFEAFCQYTIKL